MTTIQSSAFEQNELASAQLSSKLLSGAQVSNDDAKDGAEDYDPSDAAEQAQAAIDHVQQIAKTHRAEMLRAAKEQFERETGAAPTQQMVRDALQTMNDSLVVAQPEAELE